MFKLNPSRGGTLLIELLMIILGINIALWFEGVAEDFKDKELEQEYLEGLHDDLKTDLTSLDFMIEQNEKKVVLFEEIIPELNTILEQSVDKQSQTIFTPSNYSFFKPADFTYTSMQESGDFRLLSEPEIKRGILRLARRYQVIEQLQVNYIQAMDAEYIPLVMSNYDLVGGKISNPDLATNQVFRNFFAFAHQETTQRVDALKVARDEASELSAKIERQLR